MGAPAHLMPLPRRNAQLFPQAACFHAMGYAPGGTVVAGGNDMLVTNQYSAYLPAKAGGAAAHQFSYFHKIPFPRGAGHQITYFVPKRRSPASPRPGIM